jgi:CheY-like chemotaxis protein
MSCDSLIVAKKILVADDDPAIVDALQLMLEAEGYAVVTTVNGQTAHEVLTHMPDLVLLDIWMSGQDGREIARYLKGQEVTHHIPIVMISANRDTGDLASACGADGFLAKPFEMDDLLTIVAAHTQH